MVWRQRADGGKAFRDRVGDISAVPARPDAGAVDAAAAAVRKDTVHHHVEIFLPGVDLIVANQHLREAGAMRLNARIAAIAIDGGRPAEDQAAAATVEHGGADVPLARINRDRLPRDAALS